MSSQPPVSTWKCGTCGTANRFANPTCVLCNNPRPANVAMPSGGAPTQLGGSLTQLGGTPGPAPGPQAPTPSPYGSQSPSPYASPYGGPAPTARVAQSMPVGVILLCVLEGLGVLSFLYAVIKNAMVASQPMPPMPMGGGAGSLPFNPMAAAGGVGIVVNLIGLALAGFALYGFIRRLNAARIVAIVQGVLNLLFGLLMAGGGVFIMLGAAALKSSPTTGMPPIPGGPGAAAAASSGVAMLGGIVIAVGVAILILSSIILWYLSTESVKDWLCE